MSKWMVTAKYEYEHVFEVDAHSEMDAKFKAMNFAPDLVDVVIPRGNGCNRPKEVEVKVVKNAKPLILIVGKSCSGKTTLANELSRFGLEQIVSYTTRPKRSYDEKGHWFATNTVYGNHKASGSIKYETELYGYKYWCTNCAFDNGDIYVVDPMTVGDVIDNLLNGTHPRPFLLIHTWADRVVRWYRFGKRGTEPDDAFEREMKEACWDDIIFDNIQKVMDMENVKCIKANTSNVDSVKQAKQIYEELYLPMLNKM